MQHPHQEIKNALTFHREYEAKFPLGSRKCLQIPTRTTCLSQADPKGRKRTWAWENRKLKLQCCIFYTTPHCPLITAYNLCSRVHILAGKQQSFNCLVPPTNLYCCNKLINRNSPSLCHTPPHPLIYLVQAKLTWTRQKMITNPPSLTALPIYP